jgi:molybdate transport system substrate-binding protein
MKLMAMQTGNQTPALLLRLRRAHGTLGSHMRGWLTLLLIVCFVTLPGFAAAIHVFAAASLTDSLKEIAAAYEKESGDKLVFNFGASSILARQIEEGAPADVFFSADELKMDALEKKGLLLDGTRRKLLGNSLVIVVASDSRMSISSAEDLRKTRRLALAEPKTVPAGIYAKEFLTKKGLWAELEPKVVPTDNVRAALAAVESGNVDAGIVYKTDASISKKVKVAFEVPTKDAPDISYPLAVLKESKAPEPAKHFAQHLASEKAAKIFASFGFVVRR